MESELSQLRMACAVHDRLPAAIQRLGAEGLPQRLNAAVEKAVRAGRGSIVRDLLAGALADPPAHSGGLDWTGILRAALARTS